GLAGMPVRRPLAGSIALVRPFLKVGRDDVRAYLEQTGQPWRDDASNADTSRTRARIRHELLPKLAAEYNPKVADALVRLGALATASERADRQRALEFERIATISASQDQVMMRTETLMQFPLFVRTAVLRLAWRRAGWPEAGMSARRWRRLAAAVRKTGER